MSHEDSDILIVEEARFLSREHLDGVDIVQAKPRGEVGEPEPREEAQVLPGDPLRAAEPSRAGADDDVRAGRGLRL